MTAVWGLVLVYILLMLWKPALGPTDDYLIILTLQKGKWFPLWWKEKSIYDVMRLGRFAPVQGQELNLAALLFGRSARSYYLLNAVELVAFVWLFLRLF